MDIEIRLNGTLAQAIGSPRTRLTVPEGSTVGDVLQQLAEKYPAAGKQIAMAIPVIGGAHASKKTALHTSQELALLMPVAGGNRKI